MKSFEFKGEADERLEYFGRLSVIACISLCISTASISDGGDLNHEFYFYGSRIYWVLALYIMFRSSAIYSDLWSINHFIPQWSYKIKAHSGWISILLISTYAMQFMGLLNFGYLHEWIISFFIIFYVSTLYWDLKNVDILLRRK